MLATSRQRPRGLANDRKFRRRPFGDAVAVGFETKRNREALLRRFHAHAGVWPWLWRTEHVEQWIEDLADPPRRLHVSTLRNYQVTIRLFMEYLLDARYPWRVICQQRLGAAPQQGHR